MSFVIQYIPFFPRILPDIFRPLRGLRSPPLCRIRPAFDAFYFRMPFIPDDHDLTAPSALCCSTRRCIFNTNGQVASTMYSQVLYFFRYALFHAVCTDDDRSPCAALSSSSSTLLKQSPLFLPDHAPPLHCG